MMRGLILVALLVSVAWATPNPKAIDATLNKALVHYKAKRPAQALPLLDQALAQSEGLPGYEARIEYFRARCLMNLHRPDEARKALEHSIAKSTRPEDRERGRVWLAKLQRRYYGSVRVECTDGALLVTLKGAPDKPRHCPAQWTDLLPGKYELTVTGGKKTRLLSMEVVAGKALVHNLDRGTQTQKSMPQPSHIEWAWGGFARAGLAHVRGSLAEAVTVTPGLALGAGGFGEASWPVGSLGLGLRLELAYRGWGVSAQADGQESQVRTHGLALPLLAQLKLPAGLALQLGPSLEVILGSDSRAPELSTKPVSVMGTAGVSWALPINLPLVASLRYELELTDALEGVDLRRDAVLLGLGFIQ